MLISPRLIVMIAAFFPLIACTTAVPMAVLTEDGQILRGSAASRVESSFVVSDENLMCGGDYNPLRGEETVFFLVRCSDGREGFGSASRDEGGESGTGVIYMDDGTAAHFMFGEPAAVI